MKAIVSLSGGMDSATVLAAAVESGAKVQAVGFTYGSKHNKYENLAAEKLASHYRVPWRLIDLTLIMKHLQSNLLLSGGAIPEGHYEEESMKQTVVPGRNIIFCSILAGIAMSEKADEIWIGVHAGDHAIYPDCRPVFVEAMEWAIQTGTDRRLHIKTPFLHGTKTDILLYGIGRRVPYALTRTCYKDQPIACGCCGACCERLTAWRDIGQEDPIEYESRVIIPKKGV